MNLFLLFMKNIFFFLFDESANIIKDQLSNYTTKPWLWKTYAAENKLSTTVPIDPKLPKAKTETENYYNQQHQIPAQTKSATITGQSQKGTRTEPERSTSWGHTATSPSTRATTSA